MKKNLIHLIAAALLFAYALPTLTAPEVMPSFATITLAPGDSYELPPITRSTTTPMPDKPTGYKITSADLDYQKKDFVHLEKLTALTSRYPNLMGASHKDRYILKISPAIPKGSQFSIISTTQAHPNGDVKTTLCKVIIK